MQPIQATVNNAIQQHQKLTQLVQQQSTLMTGAEPLAQTSNVFSNMMLQQIQQTNTLQKQADDEMNRVISGESEDIHGLLLASEEASLAMELTLSIRDKCLEAYRSFQNMQL